MAKIKNSDSNKCLQEIRKTGTDTFLVEMSDDTAIQDNSFAVSHENEDAITIKPSTTLLGIYCKIIQI